MFKTIRSRIITIIFLMLTILVAAFNCYAYIFGYKTKQLMLKNYSLSINTFAQQLNQKESMFEDNAKDLALIGSLFYKTDRSKPLTINVITKVIANYEDALGGGIWFEPYAVDKNQKRTCFYVYHSKDGQYIYDEKFSIEDYDYHNQGWYKQIKSQITKENHTAWSLPYYENQGSEIMMITVGTGIFEGDKLIGMSTVDWELNSIFDQLAEMKPIENGFKFFDNKEIIKGSFSLFASQKNDYIIASNDPYLDNKALIGKSLKSIPWYNNNLIELTYFKYHNKKYVPVVKNLKNGMILVICIPSSEMFKELDKFIANMLIYLVLFAFLIPALLYIGLSKNIIKPISKLTDMAKKISNGEDTKIKIEKPEEFAQLASTFDQMTKNIKSITKEKEKINSELLIAKLIQESSLPSDYTKINDGNSFDIFASMDAAKEVGGDFYDFYYIDNENFMFLIADVSGKGVPAALFMMTVKTHINNIAQICHSPSDLIKIVNKKTCENNKHGSFVTMLAGIVNIRTGKLALINCGHNLPFIKHRNGEFEIVNLNANLPLGVFSNYEYKIYETQLTEGDVLFTYTDGITEALNENDEMFGENRLQSSLNGLKDSENAKEIITKIKSQIKDYTNSVPQSDDITMLCFNYKASVSDNKKIYVDEAKIENHRNFQKWLHDMIQPWNLNESIINKIDLCAEEIYVNIASYAYPESTGTVECSIEKTDDEIILKFEDTGLAYNPLEKPNPDITLSPEERPIGGLGIYMVKEMTKKISYERNFNKNILILFFNCN